MVLRWCDKRDVFFISTTHGTKSVEIYKKNVIKKPRLDQHLANYPIPWKRGKKFNKKIFFYLFELAMWNAFVLYTKQIGEISNLDFRLQIIDEYISKYHHQHYPPKEAGLAK